MKRIFHTWDKWECYRAGFYEKKSKDKNLTEEKCKEIFRDFFLDIPLFESTMEKLLIEWPNSCEHYLSNSNMNRIAWLGQAAVCYEKKLPAAFRGGFNMLSEEEKLKANQAALKFLNKFLQKFGQSELTLEEAQSKTEANLY